MAGVRTGSEKAGLANVEAAATPTAGLWQALRQGARDVWEHLGLVAAISLTWLALFTLALGLGRALPLSLALGARLALTVLFALFTQTGPTAGAFEIAHRVATHDEISYGAFWRGAARGYGLALRLATVNLTVVVLLGVNLWFYVRLRHPAGYIAALLCLYALLFWGMMAVYHGPLLWVQEAGLVDDAERRARRGVIAVLRRAFFLALAAPLYSLGLLAVVALLTALAFATGALLALFWMGGVALLTTRAARLLLLRYGALPTPLVEPIVPDEKFRLGGR